jgi:hypothetical protein
MAENQTTELEPVISDDGRHHAYTLRPGLVVSFYLDDYNDLNIETRLNGEAIIFPLFGKDPEYCEDADTIRALGFPLPGDEVKA